MKYINLKNGEKIAYNDIGTSNNIVIAIHNNMASSANFDILQSTIPNTMRLITPDLRGFGNSSYNSPVNSFEEYASDIIELIEQLEIETFSLIGWFIGGAVAMEIAATLKQRVKKMILISPVCITGYPMLKLDANGQANGEQLKTREEVENDYFRTKMIQNVLDTSDKEFIKHILDSTLYTDNQPTPEQYDTYINSALKQKSIADVYYSLLTFNISHRHNGVVSGNNKVSQITADTLVLHGNNDSIVTLEMSKYTSYYLQPNSQLIQGNFGHSPFVDAPHIAIRTILEFLN